MNIPTNKSHTRKFKIEKSVTLVKKESDLLIVLSPAKGREDRLMFYLLDTGIDTLEGEALL